MKTNIRFWSNLAQFFLKWKLFLRKDVEEIKTLILNLAFYEIMWENVVERDRPQLTLWRMRILCWISKATNTHSENVILIDFPVQQWLHERASMLRYSYITCLVNKIRTVHILTIVAWYDARDSLCVVYSDVYCPLFHSVIKFILCK